MVKRENERKIPCTCNLGVKLNKKKKVLGSLFFDNITLPHLFPKTCKLLCENKR
jgi:hypothetical protein